MLDKFGQSWSLRFVNFNIEQNYKEDCSKIQYKTSYLILFTLSFFLIYLVSQKELIWYHICFILFPIIPTPQLKSLTLELSSLILLLEDSSTPSIPSLSIYMFPSFLGHYLFFKRWEYFSILLLPKAFLVPTLLASFEFYLVCGFYLFLSLKLEKDLRSTWKKMKKHKESNHIYREIWMKTPFPVFILSQKQAIVCANYFFINFFGKDCKFEDLFKNDNFNVVLSVLKKVFQKGNKEEIMIKERNDSWLLIIRCVEWKYERCAEISIVEILEAAYSERIFAKHYQVQDHALIDLNDLIIESHQENSPASLEFFNELYKFCINLWSYQIFLEQQASYSISNDAKCIDFCIEIENTIEIFNIKQNDCNVNYRFRFCSGNHSVLVNECRLKLHLFVLFDYIRLRADKGCVVDVNLQSFDRNNNKVKYLLKVDFRSSAVTDLELNEVFRKKKKDLQEFEEFVNRFGIAYGLFYINCNSLRIAIKEMSCAKGEVKFAFGFKFKTSLLKPVTIPLNLSTKISVTPIQKVWGSLENYKQSCSKSFRLSSNPGVSIFPRTKSPDPSSSPSRRRLHSKLNPHQFPHHQTIISKTKRFLYIETCTNLNLEPGVFKVLIVDDIKQNRTIIQSYLRKILSVSCEEAADGLAAVDMYNNYALYGFRYQIIFMDLVMPKMTGFEASVRIRQKEKDECYPSTFICAITGSQDDADKCNDLEINDLGTWYLALKPVNEEILKNILQTAKVFNEGNIDF